ncbi:MAG: hypothetical protein US69_C0002G0095 [candidate division TM6 bacterium GW2011_GWF2_38_10]|nr:MAG: hypothetical protein US69_C0002G0095 [candidate division TM6 bacterium GW2011_GWF2_38_10]
MQHQKIFAGKKIWSTQDIAKELNVKKFLVHLWEKEFNLSPDCSAHGGLKGYSPNEACTFAEIKNLVVHQKLSLSKARQKIYGEKNDLGSDGAQSEVNKQHETNVFCAASKEVVCESSHKDFQPARGVEEDIFMQRILLFKDQLIRFKQLLDLE